MRTVSSLHKGLQIIEYVAFSDEGVKLTEIARHMDMASSNLSLFMNTLVQDGYLVKNRSLYQVTHKLSDLANRAQVDLFEEFKRSAKAEMERLHHLYDENVVLSVMDRTQLSVVAQIPSSQAIRIVNTSSELFLPHTTAAGKAILASCHQRDLERYMQQTQFRKLTKTTICTESALLKEVEAIREQRWALNLGEHDEHIFGVAAAILHKEKVLGAIAVQYPSFRHPEDSLQSYAEEVLKSCLAISETMSKVANSQS